jgi:hypothetical protein
VAAIAAVVGLALGFQLARWTAPESTGGAAAPGSEASPHVHAAQGAPGAELGGLSLSAAGYTLRPEATRFTAGAAQSLRFQVTGPDGKPVTNYVTVQEKPLHLVVARRDLSGYQHLHPTLGPDGVWSVPLRLASPGSWRAIADFTVVGANGSQLALALGTDLTVAGDYAPVALPDPTRESSVDGLVVSFEGTPIPQSTVPLVFRVYRNGSPLPTLEPYLGAYGHLVVLRDGDVGYVHVHADPPDTTFQARFWLTAPGPGRYRMFFEFQFAGVTHTAAYTVQLG